MNTTQLERVMGSDPFGKQQFRGVYAADQLPRKVTQYPSAYIANTDPASMPGTHWVAFYFINKEKSEFFDSYGNPPDFYGKNFEQFLKNNSSHWTFNHKTLQSLTSKVCGQFCLFYLLHRCRRISNSNITSWFRKDRHWNDRIVA